MESTTSLHLAGLNVGHQEYKQSSAPCKRAKDHDGGYAWVIVACSFFVFSVMSIGIMAFGIFITEFKHVFGWSESELGVLGGLRLGIAFMTGMFTGPLIENFGCRAVAIAAICVSALGHIICSFATSKMVIILTFGLMCGVGSGMSLIPPVVLVQRYFTKHRAIAGAVCSIGLSFFSVLTSPVVTLLIGWVGWRGALLLIGGFNLQMLVPAALLRAPPEQTCAPFGDGTINNNEKKNINTTDPPSSFGEKCKRKLSELGKFYFDKDLFNKKYVLFISANALRSSALSVYYMRQAPLALSIGIDPVRASLLPSVIAVASGAFRGVGGLLSKCMLPSTVFGVFNLLASIVVFTVPSMPTTFVSHLILAIIFGIVTGMVFGTQDVCLLTLVGLEKFPKGLSWMSLVGGISNVLGNLMIGWLLDVTQSYAVPLWVCAGLQLLGALAFMAVILIIRYESIGADEGNKK